MTEKHATVPRLEWLRFGSIYLVLALIQLKAKLLVTPYWFSERLAFNHDLLLAFKYVNNEQSRLLQFTIPEVLHGLFSVPIEDAYILQRWLFVFLAFLLFHVYLRKWFSALVSFGGVCFLAAIMPLTYMNHLQESAPLLMVTFLGGLWAIREKKNAVFALVLLIGALNNETVLILSSVYVFCRFTSWKWQDLRSLCIQTTLVSTPAWAAAAIIRWFTRHSEHIDNPWMLPKNLQSIGQDLLDAMYIPHWFAQTYLFPLFLFGAFWYFATRNWKQQDLFLRRASLMIPLFVLAHLVTGMVEESRLMIPLAFLLIPMGLLHLKALNT